MDQDQEDVAFYLHRSTTEQLVFDGIRDTLLEKDWAYDTMAATPSNILWMRHVPIESDRTFKLADPKPDVSYRWAPSTFKHGHLEQVLEARHIPQSKTGIKRSYCAPNPHVWWAFATLKRRGRRAHLLSLIYRISRARLLCLTIGFI